MIVYWVLLLTTALFAYLIGSLDTLVLASNFVFHRNLRRLGDPSVWLSNFYRIYGVKGFVKLLAVELIRDALPLLIGSLLLGIKGHADAGRAFAGFVLVLARLWPAIYGFRGSDASIAFAVAAFAVQPSVGVASAIVILAVTVLTSLDASDLADIGVAGRTPAEQVAALARLAVDSGANGLVCSPKEVGSLSRSLPKGTFFVTPGVRPAGAAVGDQKRVATPADAVRDGATHLVVGRPVLAAPDPALAARDILAEMSAAGA